MNNETTPAPLFEMCLRSLESNLNLENCFDVLHLSDAYALPELKKRAKIYMLQNFKDISQELRFLQLEVNTIIDFLKDDSLNVKEEHDVLDAVMRWLHYKEERKQHLGKVLKHVRLAHIEQAELSDRVQNEKELRQSETVRKLLDKVNFYHTSPSRRLTNQSSITRRRFNSPQVETLLLCSRNYETHLPVSEDGRKFKQIPIPTYERSFHIQWFPSNYKLGCTFYESSILPFRFFIFDFENGAWTERARFTRPQINVQLCEADGIWYAVGGREPNSGRCSTNFDSFDPSTNKWTQLAPLLDEMEDHQVLSLSGTIYVFDYRYGGRPQRLIMHEYNIDTNEWSETPPLHDYFCHLAECCALNNRIYVSCRDQVNREDCETAYQGGRIFEYNVETRKWRECANTNHEFKVGPVILNGRICALSGGDEHDSYQKYLECYDPELDLWSDLETFHGHKLYCQKIRGPYLMNSNCEDHN